MDQNGSDSGINNSPEIGKDKAARQAGFSQAQAPEDPAGGPQVLIEEAEEEKEARKTSTRSTRRKTGGDGLKGLRDKVTPSLHGRSSAMLGMDGAR
jgi:hypothetical protein